MAIELVIVAGPDKGRSFTLTAQALFPIGRGQATATRLTDPHVSRLHCEIRMENGRPTIKDSGSAGGTFINNKRITQQALRSGDLIQVGSTQILFQDTAADPPTLLPGATPAATPAPAPAAPVDPLAALTGQTLSHYDVGSVIAKGQSGMVFQARDTQSGQTVALKILRPDFSQNEEDIQRFVRAMKTVLPLRHPNLVTLYHAGRTGNYCWLAMEHVDGESLTQVIQRIGVAGMLDWRFALRTAVHIARALDYASQHQIIHRNVTPPNILVRHADKRAQLGDLMLAKATEGSLAQQITRPGQMLGDVRYMSPERTRGAGEVDTRSDIYGLGATVYALLTGRPPHEGGSLPDTIQKIRTEEPEKPKKYQLSIPDPFQDTVLRMLAKRPGDRYGSPADLLADLERVAKFQGVTV